MYAATALALLTTDGSAPSMWSDLLSFGVPPTEKIVRTIAVYLGITLIIRLVGKRLMAQMNSLDLVVVLLLSNVVQNAIIGEDNSLVGGLLGALVLVAFNSGVERLSHRFPLAYRVFVGQPTVLVRDGRVDPAALSGLGMSAHELREALRRQGADRVEEVASASIEPGGDVAVDLRRDDQAASYGDLQLAMAELREYLDDRLASAAGGPTCSPRGAPRPTSRPANGHDGPAPAMGG